MINQRLMAFWPYDKFPYILCGEIEKFYSYGKVMVTGYSGLLIKPSLILEYEEGEEIQTKLKNIETSYRIDLNEVKNKYKAIVDKVLVLPTISS